MVTFYSIIKLKILTEVNANLGIIVIASFQALAIIYEDIYSKYIKITIIDMTFQVTKAFQVIKAFQVTKAFQVASSYFI